MIIPLMLIYLSSAYNKYFTIDYKPTHNILFKPQFITNIHKYRNIQNYKVYEITYNTHPNYNMFAKFIYNSEFTIFGLSPIIKENWNYIDDKLICLIECSFGEGYITFGHKNNKFNINLQFNSDKIPTSLKNTISTYIVNVCNDSIKNYVR